MLAVIALYNDLAVFQRIHPGRLFKKEWEIEQWTDISTSVGGRWARRQADSVAGVIKGYLMVTKYKTQIKDLKAKQESVWQVPRKQWKCKSSISLIC